MARRKQQIFDDELIDKLLEGREHSAALLGNDGLIGELKKRLAERMLAAEMDEHLGDEEQQAQGNHRNGFSPKTVTMADDRVVLDIPRDRNGQFDPQLIPKYARRFPGFDDKIIAMYARGMSTRDIQAHVEEIYGITVSPCLVSAVTEAVMEEAVTWQNRPLESTYAVGMTRVSRTLFAYCRCGYLREPPRVFRRPLGCNGSSRVESSCQPAFYLQSGDSRKLPDILGHKGEIVRQRMGSNQQIVGSNGGSFACEVVAHR